MSLPEYRVIRSDRRTTALEVTRDGEVLVRTSLRTPQKQLDAFVRSHEAWIANALAQQKARREAYPEPTEEEIAELRRLAKAVLPERTAYYSRLMGLTPTSVRITSARTRFGSCSAKNGICYSWRLMRYPPEAIDYVVVHELAHIRYKNHSAQFYRFIERFLPDYKARIAMLRMPLGEE